MQKSRIAKDNTNQSLVARRRVWKRWSTRWRGNFPRLLKQRWFVWWSMTKLNISWFKWNCDRLRVVPVMFGISMTFRILSVQNGMPVAFSLSARFFSFILVKIVDCLSVELYFRLPFFTLLTWPSSQNTEVHIYRTRTQEKCCTDSKYFLCLHFSVKEETRRQW